MENAIRKRQSTDKNAIVESEPRYTVARTKNYFQIESKLVPFLPLSIIFHDLEQANYTAWRTSFCIRKKYC